MAGCKNWDHTYVLKWHNKLTAELNANWTWQKNENLYHGFKYPNKQQNYKEFQALVKTYFHFYISEWHYVS